MSTSLSPNPLAYKTGTIFTMPSFSGDGGLAVSFTTPQSRQILATYAIIITFIFSSFWELCVILLMMRKIPKNKPRLTTTALITIWNSKDPWTCFHNLLGLIKDNRSLYYFIVLLLSIATVACGLAAGIVGPDKLIIGHAAPVVGSPEFLFYPNSSYDLQDYNSTIRNQQGFAELPILRALGTAGFLQSTFDSVLVSFDNQPDEGVNGPSLRMTYSYQITGADFGLQHASGLINYAEGECNTTYEWLEPRVKNDTVDMYTVYGENVAVAKAEPDIKVNAPTAIFKSDPDTFPYSSKDPSLVRFGIVISTAHRYSTGIQQYDPWFITEAFPNASDAVPGAVAWVKDRRPALSCMQKDIWSYNGHNTTLLKLNELPGLDLPEVLISVLQVSMLMPKMFMIGVANQNALFIPSNTFRDGMLSAEKINMTQNLRLLVIASYFYARNTFEDTALVTNNFDLHNIFEGEGGRPKPGAGDFIIQVTDVDTYSVRWLILIPSVLIFLTLIRIVLRYIHHKADIVHDKSFLSNWVRKCRAYNAPQIYESVKLLCYRIDKLYEKHGLEDDQHKDKEQVELEWGEYHPTFSISKGRHVYLTEKKYKTRVSDTRTSSGNEKEPQTHEHTIPG